MFLLLPFLIAGGVMFPQDNTNPFVPIDHPILHQKIAEVPVEEIKSEKIQELIDYIALSLET